MRVLPTQHQAKVLDRLFGAYRYGYNQTIRNFGNINYAAAEADKKYKLRAPTKTETRNKLLYKGAVKPDWFNEVPNDIIEYGSRSATVSIGNAITLFYKKHKKSVLNMLKRKDLYQIMEVPVKNISKNKKSFFSSYFREESEKLKDVVMKLHYNHKLVDFTEIKHDFKVMKVGLNYYILHPIEFPTIVNDKKSIEDVVALDPGVRTFMGYFSNKNAGMIGSEYRLKRINHKIDEVVCKKRKSTGSKHIKKILGRSEQRLRSKLKHLTDEIHWKTANYLTKEFNTILIPKFETQKLVEKERPDGKPRLLPKSSARTMLTWSHFKFRTRLITKAKQRGVHVHIVHENYTSKTCTRCGHMNQKFKEPKEFKCCNCGFTCDRDTNAARNILILNVQANFC